VAETGSTLVSNPPGVQSDNDFRRADETGHQGIDTMDPALRDQLEALRDSETPVHAWGILRTDIPDSYGLQIELQQLVLA
jgi:hypothetical protein